MHTLTGAKLQKLIAVKLADRNAGEVRKGKPCIEATAHTKRKILDLSRKIKLKKANTAEVTGAFGMHRSKSLSPLFYRPSSLMLIREQVSQGIDWLVVDAHLVMEVWSG